VRFLRRLLEEDANPAIDEAVLAASAFAGLGGRGHEQAAAALLALSERKSGRLLRGAGVEPLHGGS
jgi:hypothetical protein